MMHHIEKYCMHYESFLVLIVFILKTMGTTHEADLQSWAVFDFCPPKSKVVYY